MAKIYSVISNKGGVLKTTLVLNIAGELSKKSRVLIVDTDGQCNCSVGFGIKQKEVEVSLYDCLTDEKNVDDALIGITDNLHIITAGKGMNSYSNKEGRSIKDLKNLLEPLDEYYDYIVIDTAPSMNFATLQTMYCTSEVIIPFLCEGFGMTSFVDTIQAIREVQKSVRKDLKINSVVVTKYDGRSKVHKRFLKDVQTAADRLGIKICKTKIPDTTTGSTSIMEEQRPTTLSKKWYRLKGVYANLVEEVIN